jgi:hypothetical protein
MPLQREPVALENGPVRPHIAARDVNWNLLFRTRIAEPAARNCQEIIRAAERRGFTNFAKSVCPVSTL